MPSVRGSILFPDHDVHVKLWIPVLGSNIAQERKDLDLLSNQNLIVFLLLGIEEADRKLFERSNSSNLTRREVVVFGKLDQTFHDLVSRLKDERECFGLRVDKFRFHLAPLPRC